MKILAISHEYPPIGGGGANAAYNLFKRFVSRGYEVTLVTTAYEDRDPAFIPAGLTIHEVRSRRARTDSCSFAEMFDFLIKARKMADRLVRDSIDTGKRFDAVLIFFGIPSGPIGYLLKRKYGLPYIIRFGGGDIPGFQKRFENVYKILAPAIRTIWRDADIRVANSEGLRQMALRFCDKYPFVVVPNGVDLSGYYPDKSKAEEKGDGTVNILFVSRLIERKGLQNIIPMLKQIMKATDKKIKLTVVGEGPYKEDLLRLTKENEVQQIVDFMGEKWGNELLSCYQAGDIFILPSSNEGMPNVVLEAMACGLPVVMTPCQGSDELIEGNGYVTDIPGFTDRLIELINDDEKRILMGEASRKLVAERFSWDMVVEAYITKIEKIVPYKKS